MKSTKTGLEKQNSFAYNTQYQTRLGMSPYESCFQSKTKKTNKD